MQDSGSIPGTHKIRAECQVGKADWEAGKTELALLGDRAQDLAHVRQVLYH